MSNEDGPRDTRSPVANSETDSVTKTPAPRFQYTEFDLSDATVAMIQDISNPTAWIQSNVTYPIEH